MLEPDLVGDLVRLGIDPMQRFLWNLPVFPSFCPMNHEPGGFFTANERRPGVSQLVRLPQSACPAGLSLENPVSLWVIVTL